MPNITFALLIQDNEGMTPMMRAIESDDHSTVELLADHSTTDFTLKNNKGFNSLHFAAFKGNVQ